MEKKLDANARGVISTTLTFNERMNDVGFIAVGWRSKVMKGAEMWWCTVNDGPFRSEPHSQSCVDGVNEGKPPAEQAFSCCVAAGETHVQPVCAPESNPVHYKLTVFDWCFADSMTLLKIKADVCDDTETFTDGKPVDCFRLESQADGQMEFIVAYNPDRIGNHGYQMRIGAAANLRLGIITQDEAGVADTGLIATHAIFMLFGWGVLCPLAIFVSIFQSRKAPQSSF